MVPIALALAAGTLVSEDLTSLWAGVLVGRGEIDLVTGVAACVAGIYAGDLGLWAAGRVLGRRALGWTAVRRHVTPDRERTFAGWFDRHAPGVIVGSRLLPGSRFPLYVAAGALGAPFGRFAAWTFAAVLVWTPLVVWLAAQVGEEAAHPFVVLFGDTWLARLLAPLLLLVGWQLAIRTATRRGRQRLTAMVSRIWRWEFWPMWLFYAPVVLWVAALAMRYRGLQTISAANPGMPDGGIVGESKAGILARLPEDWTVPSTAIEPGDVDVRMWQLASRITARQWAWPLVLKPDVGQRGVGVRAVRTLEEARAYLACERGRVLAQPYHPGPFEAGVFYYRMPGRARGEILSITDKQFPAVVGDGRSTVEDLIWAHPRLRMQARTFLTRHRASRGRVLAAGERLSLALAGNHAQGTLFRDGRRLITPALEERIDRIAWSYHGFFIGRFDIRYHDVERFMAGEDFAIVELNGATAESTNIYDPAGSLIGAYRQLFRQWSLVFAVGAANRARGAAVSPLARLADLLREHARTRPAFATSD